MSTALAHGLIAGGAAASMMLFATDHGSTKITIATVPPIVGAIVFLILWTGVSAASSCLCTPPNFR